MPTRPVMTRTRPTSVSHAIGCGFRGVCVYAARQLQSGREVALKWPASERELETLRALGERAAAPEGMLGIEV